MWEHAPSRVVEALDQREPQPTTNSAPETVESDLAHETGVLSTAVLLEKNKVFFNYNTHGTIVATNYTHPCAAKLHSAPSRKRQHYTKHTVVGSRKFYLGFGL